METITVVVITLLVSMVLFIIAFNFVSRDRRIHHNVKPTFSVDDAQFERAAANLLNGPFLAGNKVETLENGCRFFPAMLEAIRGAEKSITFESFIYISDEIGEKFSEALIERCKAGVRVYILCDFMGSWKFRKTHLRELKEAGINVEVYRPPNLWNLLHLNNRTHRKILIVDGKVAFTGGAGISELWDGDADKPDHWRDNQHRITGPAVAGMQGAFMDNWMQTHAEVLKDEEFFPELPPTGDMRCQIFVSGPAEGMESARLMFLLSIASAKKSIRLANAYFIPDNFLVDQLVAASKRGVEIEVIVPSKIDLALANWASCARWGPLLRSGIKIYRFEGALYHCKMFIVDECWVSIGSSNFDTRSFTLNDEMNLNVLDQDFANTELALFEKDKQRSREVSLEEWENRTAWEKTRDRMAALLRSQL